MGAQLLLLMCWQLTSPLQWQREVMATSSEGYVTKSRPVCVSSTTSTFLPLMIGVQVVCFLLDCVLAFKSRNVPGAFNEGKFITLAILNQAELFLIGLPMLMMLQSDGTVYLLLKTVFVAMQVRLLCCFPRQVSDSALFLFLRAGHWNDSASVRPKALYHVHRPESHGHHAQQ